MLALAIAFLLPITPQDYWWYLRIGKDTLATGAVPSVDALSFSQAGAPMVYHSWGAAVLFWLVHRMGGLTLTVLLRGLLVGAAYTMTWLTCRRLGAGRISSAIVLLLAVLASSNNWSLRPQLLAYPLFALCLYLLYRWQEGNSKAVYWMPVISLVWVNLHGSFIMLLLLAGAALVFGTGAKRSLALAFIASLLVTLLNPRGPGAWIYVFDSLAVASNQFSAEWSPPVNSGWQMNLFYCWLLAFPVLASLSQRKLNRLEWAWFLGFGLLALWGERYVIWFIFILAVLTSSLVGDWEGKQLPDSVPGGRAKRFLPVANLVLALLLLLLPLSLLPGIRENWWRAAPAATENTPAAATEWLAGRPDLPGPLWAEIGFASYLEFALPSRPPWMDTRFELFPVEEWHAYRAITTARFDWSSLLDERGVELLMVSMQEQPDLLAALDGAPAWCELYHDPIAVIFQRCEQ